MDDTRIIVCPFLDSLSAFYTWHDVHADPLLQTDNVAHSSLDTEQLLSAHALTSTQRGLCTEKFVFHTDASTYRGFYAERLVHTHTHGSTLFGRTCLYCCRLNSCSFFCFLFLITYISCSLSQIFVGNYVICDVICLTYIFVGLLGMFSFTAAAGGRDERRIVESAVRQNGLALEWASQQLRADRDVAPWPLEDLRYRSSQGVSYDKYTGLNWERDRSCPTFTTHR